MLNDTACTPEIELEIQRCLAGAEAAFLQDDLQAAARSLNEALSLVPDDAEILNAYGNVLLRLGDLRSACREFTKSTLFAPAHAPGFVNLAVAKLMLGDEPGAVSAVGRALALDPDNADANRLAEQFLQHDPQAGTLCGAPREAGSPGPDRGPRLERFLGSFEERASIWSELGGEHILHQLSVGSQAEPLRAIPRPAQAVVQNGSLPVPPPELRMGYHVDSAEKFLRLGEASYQSLMGILASQQLRLEPGEAMLDWGCATGRVLRYFAPLAPACEVWGSDVDVPAIEWCLHHLSPPFKFLTASSLPHLPFPDGKFKFLYGLSVLTHMASLRDMWLLELARILHKGGCAVLTIHDENTWQLFRRAGMPAWVPAHLRDLPDLPQNGLEIRGSAWYHTYTFFRSDYVRKAWGQYFEVVDFVPQAEGYQTAVVLRKA
jgi:SAM-dependent methyltransferase